MSIEMAALLAPETANESLSIHSGASIRIGCTQDIDKLVAIDSNACVLFERAGLQISFSDEHELAIAERRRWLRCLAAGSVRIAVDAYGRDVGFAAIGVLDDEPYLDQLSVIENAMRRGIGTQLLHAAMRMAAATGGHHLWLTTYSHLSWNRRYYERHGFLVTPPEQCGEDLQRELLFERRLLPMPDERVVMRRDLTGARQPHPL